MANKKVLQTNETNPSFPPVVSVLGHVDHGKTTLLDTIRKSSIAEREKGGITQKIGASSVEIMHEGHKRDITFIDTPGHEAFMKMRGRGAQVADVCLLIVSAVDGVQPQTRESIAILKESNTPFIVVLTKTDMPTKNTEKAKQELLKEGLSIEGFGGNTPLIEVSAKTNHNIKELLDMILLVFDLHKAADYNQLINKNAPLSAIVIESKLDSRTGPKATVVIKNGSIKPREELQVESQLFRIRFILNTLGKQLQQASVGEAVEIIGFETVPNVGAIIINKTDILPELSSFGAIQKPLQRDLIYRKENEETTISTILIADSQGSLEAILNAFPSGVRIVAKKTGEVNEADILLAKTTGSIVLSFNTKIKPDVEQLAYTEKVLFRKYEIIYELLNEVEDALEGKMLAQMEQVYGKAKVLAKFPFEKSFAFGIAVAEGRVARGDKIRILRNEEQLGEGSVISLRIGKNPASKVEKGHEAGLIIQPPLDIQVGDMLISHS